MHSAHLYQLMAYLRNQSIVPDWQSVAGILLYPAVDHRFDVNFSLNGHALRVVSIDLNRPWSEIHSVLMEICGDRGVECGAV